MSKIYHIYVLKDPRNGSVRYVGMTCMSLERRLRGHYYNKERLNQAKAEWLDELKANGLKAVIEEIETVTEDGVENSEQFWIEHYRLMGANLLNITNGGYGTPGLKFTEEVKQKLSKAGKGRPKSAAFKAKMSEYNRTRVFTPATRGKIKKANAIYWSDPENRLRVSRRKKNDIPSLETRAKQSLAQRKRWTGEEREKLREMRKGENNGRAKLTLEQVSTIRERLGKGESPLSLSREYNVARTTIYHIKNGRLWK